MKTKAGQVALLRNSMFEEMQVEFVELFPSLEEAEQHVQENLLEEPGDVYIIAPIVSVLWAQVSVRRRADDTGWLRVGGTHEDVPMRHR